MGSGNEQAPATVQTQQVIAGALIAGVLAFLVIVLGLRASARPMLSTRLDTGSVLGVTGLGFGLMAVVLSLVVPGQVVAAQRRQLRPGDALERKGRVLMGAHLTRLIVAMAILEGAAFFNLIAVMQEGSAANLGMALLLWLAMIAQFPTRGRIEAWLEDQLTKIDQE